MAKPKQEIRGRTYRPALTPEAREQQMIAMAMDLVEQRLQNGTASAQEVTHFLKLGSTKAEVELEKLRAETQLAVAKKDNLKAQERSDKKYQEALDAIKRYSGHRNEIVDEDIY